MIKVAFYDDLMKKPERTDIMELADWLAGQPDCQLHTFARAKDFVAAIVDGFRPDIAIVDIKGDHDPTDEIAFKNSLRRAGGDDVDVLGLIDQKLLEQAGSPNWLAGKYYGVGLLALLTAVQCQHRMAFTEYESSLGDALTTSKLANSGMCKKNPQFAQSRVSEFLEEVRSARSATRDVPDLYEVLVVVEPPGDDVAARVRVSITDRSKMVTKSLVFESDAAVVFFGIASADGRWVRGGDLDRQINEARADGRFGPTIREDVGFSRNVINKIRKEDLADLADVFGSDFATHDAGLIRSHSRYGFAIAGNVRIEDALKPKAKSLRSERP